MLEISNLSIGYDSEPLLKSVHLSLFDGVKLEVIIGRSGSGKTTLLKTIAGLMAPQSGKILWEKSPIRGPQETLVAGHPQIQLVHQDFQLPPYVTVQAYLRRQLPFATEAVQSHQIQQLAAQFNLSHLLLSKTHKISGGQKQRVAIAGALAAEPALLLLDEPFSNLDPMSRQELVLALQKHQTASPTSILAVMHEPELALQLAERLHILHDGKFVASGQPAQLFFAPDSIEVAGLLGQYSLLPAESIPDPHGFHLLNNQLFLRPVQIIAQAKANGKWQLKHWYFAGNSQHLILEKAGITLQTTVPANQKIKQQWAVRFLPNPLTGF